MDLDPVANRLAPHDAVDLGAVSGPFLSTSWYRVEHLKPRLKSHLKVTRHRYWGGAWYVVDDTVTGKVHRFTPAAYLFIGRLDGSRSVDQAWKEAAEALGEDAPTQGDALQLLGQLHGADLVDGERPPDVSELMERHGKQSRQLTKSNLLGPTSFRVPLFDPDRLLAAMAFVARPFVGWLGLLVVAAFVLPAALLAGANWGELTENISDRVLSYDNMLVMALVYPLMKAVHELGHGLVAKDYGATVREFGIMVLVFFPVPYVDASSASALPSKYQRAAVSAAGVIAELILAAGAFYLWLVLEPGFERTICFNVMAIGGISTLLVNGNPLLRFDGYFVFSDLIETPNLAGRSNRFITHLVEKYAFGMEKPQAFEATAWEKAIFVVYAPLAFIYRVIVTVSICLFIATGFFVVGVILAIWSLIQTFIWPAAKGLWTVFISPKLRRNRRRAVLITSTTIAAAALALFVLPVPHMALTQGVVWLPDEGYVRTQTDGFVAAVHVTEGFDVAPDQKLVDMDLPAIQASYESQVWRVKEAELKLAAARADSPSAALLVEEELREAVARLGREDEVRFGLNIRAGVGGRFVGAQPLDDLPGRYLKKGEVVGYVMPPRATILRVVVPQEQIDLVRSAFVGIELRPTEGEPVASEILRDVPAGQFVLPSSAFAFSAGGMIPTDPRDQKNTTALSRVFQFDVALPEGLDAQAFGSRIDVRFRFDDMPAGLQAWRWARRVFLANFGT